MGNGDWYLWLTLISLTSDIAAYDSQVSLLALFMVNPVSVPHKTLSMDSFPEWHNCSTSNGRSIPNIISRMPALDFFHPFLRSTQDFFCLRVVRLGDPALHLSKHWKFRQLQTKCDSDIVKCYILRHCQSNFQLFLFVFIFIWILYQNGDKWPVLSFGSLALWWLNTSISHTHKYLYSLFHFLCCYQCSCTLTNALWNILHASLLILQLRISLDFYWNNPLELCETFTYLLLKSSLIVTLALSSMRENPVVTCADEMHQLSQQQFRKLSNE